GQPQVQGDGATLPHQPPAPDEQQEQQRQHGKSADADPFQDLHRRSPHCAGRACAGAALSARTVTPSDVTDRNPPDTSQVSSSPDSGFTRTCPGSASCPSSGAWPGRIPSSPSVVRATTISAWPVQTFCSTATTSTFSSRATTLPSTGRHVRRMRRV